MALLTIPSVTKGTPATVTLDKTVLMTLLSETSDPYYANASNLKSAVVQYRSADGNQTKNMEFDLSQVSPSSKFYTSSNAKDVFEIQKIIVTDFDGGFIQIPKASLPSGLDIDMSGGGPSSSTLELYHFDGAGVGVNGNDFTQFGTLTYNPGKFASGVSGFSVNAAYLKRDAGFLSPIGSGDFTVELWAKLNDGSSQTAFAVINDPSPGIIPTEIKIGLRYNGNGQWFDYLVDGNLALSIDASGKKDNNWHHIVLQRNAGVLRGFIDGAFVSSVNYATSVPSSGYELTVGRSGSSSPSYWEGEIDELRISNAAIYNIAGFTPPVAPLS